MKKWQVVVAGVGIILAVPIGCSILSTTASVTTAPGRVVQKTLKTDNIIGNYEAFFNRKAQYDARVSQIKEQEGYLAAETDKDERIRLRMELSAMRSSCRDLATQYNADAVKANRALFRSKELPETLSESTCNA